MILVTVFKDRLRYEKDLRKSFQKFHKGTGLNQNSAWAMAKEVVSKVDFTQKINVSSSFFKDKSKKEIQDDAYALGHGIAENRRFKVELSFDK